MAGVAGRSGRRVETPFRDALRLALARRDTDEGASLIRLANNLIDKAEAGDMQAMTEIANRLDGKPPQQVTHEGGETPVQMKIIAVWGGTKAQDDTGGTGD